MAKRVTEEDIKNINETYLACGTITKTAELTGWSTSTVRKYLVKDYTADPNTPIKEEKLTQMNIEDTIKSMLEFDQLTVVTDAEKKEISKLWKELIA